MARAVYVCQGKRCSERPKQRKALVAKLEKVAQVEDCSCMKICSGPVAGLEIEGSMEWFKELDSGAALKAMRQLIKTGKLPKALSKRRVDKRSGRKPRRKKG